MGLVFTLVNQKKAKANMDTLDLILKTHPMPIHLRLKKGEFELVVVTEYPHGYDVSNRHICGNYHDAFRKAIEFPQVPTGQAYEWRIYSYGQIAIAQSPNLHQWFPDKEPDTLTLQNQLTAMTRDRDEWRESCKIANRRFESNDRYHKMAIQFRKMLEQVVGLRNWIEFQLLRGDIEKLLKQWENENNG